MNVMTGKRIRSAAILVGLALSLTACLSWFLKEPEVAVTRIIVDPRSLSEMTLTVGLQVKNPNGFDLKLTSFEYTVFLNGEEIGKGRLEKELLLPSSAVTEMEAPVSARFKNLGGSLLAMIALKDLPYKIEGRASVSTSFGSRDFTIQKEGRINL